MNICSLLNHGRGYKMGQNKSFCLHVTKLATDTKAKRGKGFIREEKGLIRRNKVPHKTIQTEAQSHVCATAEPPLFKSCVNNNVCSCCVKTCLKTRYWSIG